MRTIRMIGVVLALGAVIGLAPAARAAGPPEPGDHDLTPPRLSLAEGQVSFWRPGADDWATAQVNTPLAPGDEISTDSPGNVEIQIGSHAFVRGWTNTQIGLENQEPDFIQFKLTDGSAVFDLRRLDRGRTVEVDTPNAAFTIGQPGYYRVDVAGDRTSFITRRAGQATVIPSGGQPFVVTPSEELVIDGTSAPRIASYVAPPPDTWDQWNYARTDRLLEAVSGRYLAPGMYGESELDQYGTWRLVPSYGSVWVPTGLRAGWRPYSTGSWVRDPFYGWTWVDSAPWGWAPYHYGRWVFVDGYWAWAPGPVVTRPVYAPALVAFFGGPGVGINVGGPLVGWVALGWGEPVVPWWGRPGFIHEPSWRGWGGPRVVNEVVVTSTTVVNVQSINVYRNARVGNAVVVVNENRFGRGPIGSAREARVDEKTLHPTHDAPRIAAQPASFVPTATRGMRPPEASLKRSVVATRPPHVAPESASGGERKVEPRAVPAPAPHLVSTPPPRESTPVPARPPFGQSTVERPVTVRSEPPSPPRTRPSRPSPATATPPVTGRPGVAAPPSDQRLETPRVAVPTSTAPASPGAWTPPPARRIERRPVAAPATATSPPVSSAPPARRIESPPPAPAAAAPPSSVQAAPPARRAESPPAAPTAAAPAVTRRAAPPQGVRSEGAGQPAPRLPGEPANRLAPSRGEARPLPREPQ